MRIKRFGKNTWYGTCIFASSLNIGLVLSNRLWSTVLWYFYLPRKWGGVVMMNWWWVWCLRWTFTCRWNETSFDVTLNSSKYETRWVGYFTLANETRRCMFDLDYYDCFLMWHRLTISKPIGANVWYGTYINTHWVTIREIVIHLRCY